MTGNALLKLCKETWVFESSMTEKPITPAEVQLIFTSELTSPQKVRKERLEKSDRLDYNDFLSCLIRIAQKCYPSSKSPEEAMQQLLMDNILPLACRRKPADVSSVIRQPVVVELYDYYKKALKQLFRFYATSSANNAGSKALLKNTFEKEKSFDESKQRIDKLKKSENSLSDSIGYGEFVRFSSDFGMQSSMGLTTLDLGDIYLSVIQMSNFDTVVRKMTFSEFWESLVRCALVAFKEYPGLPLQDKVKSMFLYMWRHIQQSVQEQVNGTVSTGGGLNTYKGGLIRGAQILNERFISAWEKDGYKDYLDTKPSPPSFNSTAAKANSMMNKLITRSKDALAGTSLNSTLLDERDAHSSTGGKRVIIDIDDDADLGDERIKPSALRLLLQNRPDIASLLHACVLEEGLESNEKVFQECKLTSGRATVNVPLDNPLGGISIGLSVSGTGIPPGVTVAAIDFEKSIITLTSVVALSGAFTLTFTN